jgi:hypothetical protein
MVLSSWFMVSGFWFLVSGWWVTENSKIRWAQIKNGIGSGIWANACLTDLDEALDAPGRHRGRPYFDIRYFIYPEH